MHGLLRSKQRDCEWEHILKLNSKLWSLFDPECGILPALIKVELSSSSSPVEEMLCLVCNISSRLVLLWMAEGLINQPLIWVLSTSVNWYPGHFSNNLETVFVMHDFISDLPKSVAGQLCVNLEHNKNYINLQDTRHVSYNRCYCEIFKKFEALKEVEKLPTLIALPL